MATQDVVVKTYPDLTITYLNYLAHSTCSFNHSSLMIYLRPVNDDQEADQEGVDDEVGSEAGGDESSYYTDDEDDYEVDDIDDNEDNCDDESD